MKFWMIANVADAEENWDRYRRSFFHGHLDDARLPAAAAPRFMHFDRERAEKELLRLKSRNPDGEFVLLEAVQMAEDARAWDGSRFVRCIEVTE